MMFSSYLFLFLNSSFFFFFNDTATTEIYTLSLHDALPIFHRGEGHRRRGPGDPPADGRSEEHTSELQSRENLVCRLMLEKKKKKTAPYPPIKKSKIKDNRSISKTK